MDVSEFLEALSAGLEHIDKSNIAFKTYLPGVGPYSETNLLRELATFLVNFRKEFSGTKTQRTPDLLIPSQWAVEAKLVRPYGDNGKLAEHWSQNLLHPYEGNTSLIGDTYKLSKWDGPERRLVIAFTFSHDPAQVDLEVIIEAFEMLSKEFLKLPLGNRFSKNVKGLQHPVHQQATIYAWEVLKH